MANTFGKQNRIVFDTTQIQDLTRQMVRFQHNMEGRTAEKLLDNTLRKAVKPWQEALNNGKMYKWLDKDQGRLQDPFGNTKIRGKRKHVYGRRVGPKLKGKTGGWFAHFFATPAKQIKRKAEKRVPFFSLFRAENGNVAALAKEGIEKLVRTMAKKSFR